jgi:hypothetical protein
LTITATDARGTPQQSTVVTLTVAPIPVPDFAITASPANLTVRRKQSGDYTITVTPSGGFSDAVAFTLTGCPANTSYVFSPASVGGGGTATLTVSPSSSAPRDTVTLVIIGTSPSMTWSTTVSLRVR